MADGDDWVGQASFAGVAGPVGFIGAWIVGGFVTAAAYSPVDDAISRLAAVGSDVRWVMTAGFVVFGLSMQVFAVVLWKRLNLGTAVAISLTGLATLGVALTPLDRSESVDQLHSVVAGLGYLTLGLAPVLAWRSLSAAGNRLLASGGLAAAAVAVCALPLSLTDLPTGFFQRLGLTAVDLWIVATAMWLRRPQS